MADVMLDIILGDGPCADHIVSVLDLKPKYVTHDDERWEYSFTGWVRGQYPEFKVTNHWKGRMPLLTNVEEGD